MSHVTVLLPVRNGGRYLAEALESVARQTYPEWDLLVIDDGSDDESPTILERFQHQYQHVRILRQPALGLVAALNRGLDQATGEFIARHDADDIMYPNRLAVQVQAMHHHPTWAVCGSDFRLIDAEGRPGVVGRFPYNDTAIRWQALFYSPFPHPGVMLRREVIERHGLRYDPNQVLVEDFDLWQRLLAVAPGGNLPTVLFDYRQHPAAVSSSGAQAQQQRAAQLCLRQMRGLGVALDEAAVVRLRAWHNRFPARLEAADFPLAQTLWQLLQAFSQQPVREGSLAAVRGRWLARLLLTPAPGLKRASWRAQLSAGDWASLALYVLRRLARSG